MKLKHLLKFRVFVLLFFIILSLVAINPTFSSEGVSIKGVEKNSTAASSGITYDPSVAPTRLEVIKEINGEKINNIESIEKKAKSV